MRLLILEALPLALLLALASCDGTPKPRTPEVFISADQRTDASQQKAVEDQTVVYVASDKNFNVRLAYPREAAKFPALNRIFTNSFTEALSGTRDEVVKLIKEYGKEVDFRIYECSEEAWILAADTPRWLSLMGSSTWFSSGMAHQNSSFDGLLWNKQLGAKQSISELFLSTKALSKAIRRDFCRTIDQQRRRLRAEQGSKGTDGTSRDCLDPTNYTIVPGSKTGQAFEYLDIYLPAYAAGSFSEGTYDVRLPITKAIILAVKSQYKQDFHSMVDPSNLGWATTPPALTICAM